MKKDNLTKSQSQQKGTKAEGSVGHGINNTAQWLPSDDSAPSMGKKGKQLIDYSTFPVRVKMVLRELAEFVYEPELITIADYFRHFDFEVQHKMAQFFFDEYFRYDTYCSHNINYIGIPFLDNILREMVKLIKNGSKHLNLSDKETLEEKKEQLIDYSTHPVRVRMVLRELAEYVYEPEVMKIADYFRPFSYEVKNKMAKFFFDEYFYNGPLLLDYHSTGFPFVDKTLKEMVELIKQGIKYYEDE